MAAIEAPSLVMKTETHCHSNPLNSESFELRVLVKRTSSVYVHHTLAVSHNARDEEIMTALREVHQLAKRRLMDLGQLLLMRRIAIDLEDQQSQIIHITDNERDDFLTQAFRKPSLLRRNTNLNQLLQKHDALTIGYAFDRMAAWAWTFVAILISLVSGVVYTVAAKDVNTGLAVGTAVLAVLLAIQGLLVFLGR